MASDIDMASQMSTIYPDRRYHTLIIQTSLSTFLSQLLVSELIRNQFIQAIINTGFMNCQIDFPLITKSDLSNQSNTITEIYVTEISDEPAIADWSAFDHTLSKYAKRNIINDIQSRYGKDHMIDAKDHMIDDSPCIEFNQSDYDYMYDDTKDLISRNTIYFESNTLHEYICTVVPSLKQTIDNDRMTLMRFFKSGDYETKHQLIINLIRLVELIIMSNPLAKIFISSGSDIDWIHFKIADTPVKYMHPKLISYYSHYNRPISLYI
jgi:hypothetical protein